MINNYILPFIVNLAEFSIAILFFSSFMTKREIFFSGFFNCIIVSAFSIVLFCVNSFDYPVVNTLFVFMLTFLILAILFRGNIALYLAFAIIFTMLSATSELIIAFLLLIFSQLKLEEMLNNQYLYLITGILGKIILALIINLLAKFFPHKYSLVNKGDVFLLITFPFFALGTMLVILNFSAELHIPIIQNLLVILLQIGLLVSSVLVFFIYDSALHKQELETQLKISEKTHETHELLFKEQQRSIETGRRYIHDFKNHLNNIKQLYSDGNAEAMVYHDNLINQFEDIMTFQMIDVNNYVISNIFERVRQQCKLNNIELKLDIQYDQLNFINPTDASMLFDNIFDNAISACMQLEKPRWIRANLYKTDYYVIIEVANSKNNMILKEGQRFLSTRRKYKSSGYGVESIRDVSKRYQGDILVKHSEDEFSITIRLSLSSLH